MKLTLPLIAATSIIATSAFAQTPPPASPAPTAPAEKMAPSDSSDSLKAPSTESESLKAPSTESTVAAPSATSAEASGPTLSDDEAKAWINKVVYSSDDKNVGEISAIERDSNGQVKEIHADIGGFLGLGETRVRVMPSQFKFVGDRVVLNVTSEDAKALPKVEG